MEDARTPAGYFIAIVAVIGGTFLMPPFPIVIMIAGPLLLLGLLAYSLWRHWVANQSITPEQPQHDWPYVRAQSIVPAARSASSIPSQGTADCIPIPTHR